MMVNDFDDTVNQMELKLKNSANQANLIQLSDFYFAYYLSVTTVHLKAVEFQALDVITLGFQAYFSA